jgi:hypothetical protein
MQKFYTKPKIARRCCEILKEHVNIDRKNDLIIEPSAGDGAFIPSSKKLCNSTIFIDIKPDNIQVAKHDYLSWSHPPNISKYRKVHIIGNPPFGFKGSMAIKFLKKSAEYADTIAFILPLSFAKKSMQHSVPLHFHLIHAWILPINSFKFHQQDVDIPSIFQIWGRRNTLRKEPQKISPKGYKFVKNPLQADVAIRRVGSNAGKIYIQELHNRNHNSHYFIKVDNLRYKQILQKKRIIHNKAKALVTGPLSISKKDMTKALNKLLQY